MSPLTVFPFFSISYAPTLSLTCSDFLALNFPHTHTRTHTHTHSLSLVFPLFPSHHMFRLSPSHMFTLSPSHMIFFRGCRKKIDQELLLHSSRVLSSCHRASEHEFLFTPYSIFIVVSVTMSVGSAQNPHVIELEGDIENHVGSAVGRAENQPLALWY